MDTANVNTDPKSPFESLTNLLRRCIHGHDTDVESICHYQDVFGHSCIEDLEKAADSEYKEAFWRLYDEAYGTVQLINFYGKHSPYCRHLLEQIDDLECSLEEEKTENKKLQEAVDDLLQKRRNLTERVEAEISSHAETAMKLSDAEKEIERLKARLFDMMEAQK